MSFESTTNAKLIYGSSELGPRSIRLLELESSRREDADLRGKLRTISLDDAESYYALSYVWGSFSTDPDIIDIDGIVVPITTNCRDALVAIRNRFPNVSIWIDALSINQSSDAEKIEQIALMQDIYSTAETVLVWLGEESADSKEAMDWIIEAAQLRYFCVFPSIFTGSSLRISTVIRRLVQNLVWCIQCRLQRFRYVSPQAALSDLLSSRPRKTCYRENFVRDLWEANLNDVLSRPWIQRAWTFQELVLANNIMIGCGQTWLPWEHFVSGLAVAHFDIGKAPDGAPIAQNVEAWISLAENWIHLDRSGESNTACYSNQSRQIRQSLFRTQEWFCGIWQLLIMVPILILETIFLIRAVKQIWYENTIGRVVFRTQYFLFTGIIGRLILRLAVRHRTINKLIFGGCLSACKATIGRIMRNLMFKYHVPHRSTLARYFEPTPSITMLTSREALWPGSASDFDYYINLFLDCKTLELLESGALLVIGVVVLVILLLHDGQPLWGLEIVPWILATLIYYVFGRPSDDQVWRFTGENDISGFRDHTVQDPHRMIIVNVLRALRSRKSQKPIDRAYALYGVLESQGLAIATPDANSTLEDAYRDLFLRLIEWGLTLNLLLDAGIGGTPGQLTWVPDWTSAQKRYWLDEDYLYGLNESDDRHDDDITIHDDKLGVKADFAGQAAITLPLVLPEDAKEHYYNKVNDPYYESDVTLIDWVQMIRRDVATPHRYDALGDALMEILLGRLKIKNGATKRGFRRWFRYFTDNRLINDSASSLSPFEYSVNLIRRLRSDVDAQAYKFHRYLCREIVQSRALCMVTTDSGTYMATGSTAMKADDNVVWVRGVSVPLILRPGRGVDCFQYVGPVIIPGFKAPKTSSYRKILLE